MARRALLLVAFCGAAHAQGTAPSPGSLTIGRVDWPLILRNMNALTCAWLSFFSSGIAPPR